MTQVATIQEKLEAMALPEGYKPSADESYMCDLHLAYFLRKLQNWKKDVFADIQETLQQLQNDTVNEPDLTDRAATETDRSLELRTRDRERKLIKKIDEAIQRIYDGEYGYCEETGEPIGLARLEARPNATLTLEAQERHERDEKVHRDE